MTATREHLAGLELAHKTIAPYSSWCGEQLRLLVEQAKSSPSTNSHGWISVDDRLPDEHKAEYLCLFAGGQQQVTEWLLDDTDGWVFWYGEPTHWMPLLAAPTEQVKP